MDTLLQKIFDRLATLLPANWEKTVLHAVVQPGSQSIYFYTRVEEDETFFYSGELVRRGLFTEQEFARVRFAIGKEIYMYLKTIEEPWTGLTLTVEKTGQFTVDYEYGEPAFDIPAEWKEKYLR